MKTKSCTQEKKLKREVISKTEHSNQNAFNKRISFVHLYIVELIIYLFGWIGRPFSSSEAPFTITSKMDLTAHNINNNV